MKWQSTQESSTEIGHIYLWCHFTDFSKACHEQGVTSSISHQKYCHFQSCYVRASHQLDSSEKLLSSAFSQETQTLLEQLPVMGIFVSASHYSTVSKVHIQL